jgi:thiazole/oxazole-forming peptide maturase SagD family component
LFYPGRDILVPAQLLFVAYAGNRAQHEVRFAPAFSTGTAAHSRADEALLSALLEAIEIDALMLHWYTQTPAPALSIDTPHVPELLPDLFSKHSGFDVFALDLRSLEGVDAHVTAAVLSNKKDARPLLVMGAQAHLDPVHAVYRAMAEAIAVSFLGIFGPVYLPGQYSPGSDSDSDGLDFTDLDRNVGYFADPTRAAEKRAAIGALVGPRRPLSALDSYSSGDTRDDLARLLGQLSHVSEYGVYLDITPPEALEKGWRVMRTFIPELVTMCVPGVPYSLHPRMAAFGGVRNRYPHPLP